MLRKLQKNYDTFSDNETVTQDSIEEKKALNLSIPLAVLFSDKDNKTALDPYDELEKEIDSLQSFIEAIEQEIKSYSPFKLLRSEKYMILLAIICWSISLPLVVTSAKNNGEISGPGLIFGIWALTFSTTILVRLGEGKARFYDETLKAFNPIVQTSAAAIPLKLETKCANSLSIAKALLMKKTLKYNALPPKLKIIIESSVEDSKNESDASRNSSSVYSSNTSKESSAKHSKNESSDASRNSSSMYSSDTSNEESNTSSSINSSDSSKCTSDSSSLSSSESSSDYSSESSSENTRYSYI